MRELQGIAAIVGYPEYDEGVIYNSAALIDGGRVRANHRKECLPNYKVFDEKRYFTASPHATVFEFQGIRCGLLICEDIWEQEPARRAKSAGAEFLIVINGSPYELNYQARRERVARERVRDVGLPMVYVNVVGGQDEFVFDGGAFAMNAAGEIVRRAPAFEPGLYLVEVTRQAERVVPVAGEVAPWLAEEPSVYRALVLGVRDYVDKHHFPGVVIGLSGGSRFRAHARDRGRRARRAACAGRHDAFALHLGHESRGRRGASARAGCELQRDTHRGHLRGDARRAARPSSRAPSPTRPRRTSRRAAAACCSWRSRTRPGGCCSRPATRAKWSVGYATLYGDMAGGFAPIKDCSKLLVYRLARYRNALGAVIPERVLTRPPSAELRPDQKDTDSLPPYDSSRSDSRSLHRRGSARSMRSSRAASTGPTVGRVLDMVKRNEYKRRQAPPGVRVSGRAFGRDWRYPITSGYESR